MTRPDMYPGEENVAFYYAIGMAVTQWAHIEMMLSAVVQKCLGNGDNGATTAAFWSIENFRSKLGFANKAFEVSLPNSPLLSDWRAISARVESLSATRNEIAHSRVIVYPNARGGRRYVIVPKFPKPTTKKSKPDNPPIGSIGVKDIYQASMQFSTAANRLLDLRYRLDGHAGPFEERALQEPQPLSLAQLRRQIQLAQGLPPRS